MSIPVLSLILFMTISTVLLPGKSVAADTFPLPFAAEYEARYGGFRARAERSLEIQESGQYHMTTHLALRLLGKTISAITEQSQVTFDAENGFIFPDAYSFEQTGLGKRYRAISFDWNNAVATVLIEENSRDITLEGKVTDNLSAYLELHRQLVAGEKEIRFQGIDKDEVEEFRYEVQAEESIETPLGIFDAVRVARIRPPGSDRSTTMWFARDWGYLLLKLVQEEPGSSRINLSLRNAVMDGAAVNANDVSEKIDEDQ